MWLFLHELYVTVESLIEFYVIIFYILFRVYYNTQSTR